MSMTCTIASVCFNWDAFTGPVDGSPNCNSRKVLTCWLRFSLLEASFHRPLNSTHASQLVNLYRQMSTRSRLQKEQKMLLMSIGNVYRNACDRGDENLFLHEVYTHWFTRYPVRMDDPELNHWAEGHQKTVSNSSSLLRTITETSSLFAASSAGSRIGSTNARNRSHQSNLVIIGL